MHNVNHGGCLASSLYSTSAFRQMALAAGFLSLVACGGGGSSNKPEQPSAPAQVDTTPPTITSSFPANNATLGSSLNKRPTIRVSFSEPVKNVNSTNVTFKKGGDATAIPITIKLVNGVYEFTLGADIVPGTSYTMSFGSGITDEAGNAFANKALSYTAYAADTIRPTIESASPANNAILGSSIDKRPTIRVSFSEPVKNVNSTNVTFTKGSDDTVLPITINLTNGVYEFTLGADIVPGTSYIMNFKSGITDEAGNTFPENALYYTAYTNTPPTVTSSPANNTTDLARTGATITLTFSEEVKGVSASSVRLATDTAGTLVVETTLESKGNNVYTITPTGSLSAATSYYIVLDYNAITDLDGAKLDYSSPYRLSTASQSLPQNGVEVSAWVGSQDTEIVTSTTLPTADGNTTLHGYTNADCNINNGASCSQYSTQALVKDAPVTNTASTLARVGYYQIDYAGDQSSQVVIGATKFHNRRNMRTITHNNKLWVIGGHTSQTYNDVWSSEDGANWVRVLSATSSESATQFGQLRDFSAVSYNGKMWVIAGHDMNANGDTNDVWSSTDGKTWTKVPPADGVAKFDPRADARLLVHNNKMYLLGGTRTSSTAFQDIWSSTDGSTWTKEAGTLPAFYAGPLVFFYGDDLWYIGAEKYNGIHKSSDAGVTWTTIKESSNAVVSGQYPIRQAAQALLFDDKLWVIGGICSGCSISHNTLRNDVWYADLKASNAGANWQKVDTTNSFPERIDHAATVKDNKLWVLGGLGNGPYLSDVWSSSDGVSWERPAHGTLSGRQSFQVARFNGKFFSYGGFNTTSKRSAGLHVSDDGITWRKVTTTGDVINMADMHQMLAFDGKLWLIAGRDMDGKATNKVFSSTDGVNWLDQTVNTGATTEAGAVNMPARFSHQTAVFDNKLWVIAGRNGSGNYTKDIWTLEAGASKKWVKRTDPPFSDRGYFQAVTFDNKLWVISGIGSSGMIGDVWTLEAGNNATWVNTNVSNTFVLRRDHQAAVLGDKLYIVAGRSASPASSYLKDVWSLSKGSTSWTKVTDSADFGARILHQMVSDGSHLYLFSGYTYHPRIPGDVWRSADGDQWRKGTKATLLTP